MRVQHFLPKFKKGKKSHKFTGLAKKKKNEGGGKNLLDLASRKFKSGPAWSLIALGSSQRNYDTKEKKN